MSKEGGEAGGGRDGFLWENQSWAFSNSDDSGGSEEKSGKKVEGSSLNSQIAVGVEKAAAPGKKRGRGGVSKNGKGSGEGKEEGKGGGESDHEIHIWTERERRKKMRNMFTNLSKLLELSPKADKSTIVDQAVNTIKTLQQTLQKLQKQKLERLQGATTFGYEPSVIIPQKQCYDSREAFLADQVSSNNQLGAAINAATNCSSSSLSVLRYPVNFQTWTSSNVVLNICGDEAQISVCSPKKPGLFTAICQVLENHKIEVVSAYITSDCNRTMYMIQAHVNGGSDQFPGLAFPVEEIYKQAAGEIMLWVSS